MVMVGDKRVKSVIRMAGLIYVLKICYIERIIGTLLKNVESMPPMLIRKNVLYRGVFM